MRSAQERPGEAVQLAGQIRKPRILDSQATEKRRVRRTVGIGVLSAMAPRDTFTGVRVGRKAGSEAGEAIRWGHCFLTHTQARKHLQDLPEVEDDPDTRVREASTMPRQVVSPVM